MFQKLKIQYLPKFLICLASLCILGGFIILFIGSKLIAPHPNIIGAPATKLNVEKITIKNLNEVNIAGWFMPGIRQKGGILLLHSIRSDRREMLQRAIVLNRAGYTVLLVDLQAHGETPGEYISFGYYESITAHRALSYLSKRIANRPVGVIGVSLGAAAALLGPKPLPVDAMVLEAVYSNIQQAVQNRIALRLGNPGRFLAPLLTWQIKPRLGIPERFLSPIAAIEKISAPLFLIAGSEDQHTLVSESQQLFFRAPQPKSIWIIAGAAHENFHQYAKTDYERRVLNFFDQYLSVKP